MVGSKVNVDGLPYRKPYSLSLYELFESDTCVVIVCNDALGYSYGYPTELTHMGHKNKWLNSVW